MGIDFERILESRDEKMWENALMMSLVRSMMAAMYLIQNGADVHAHLAAFESWCDDYKNRDHGGSYCETSTKAAKIKEWYLNSGGGLPDEKGIRYLRSIHAGWFDCTDRFLVQCKETYGCVSLYDFHREILDPLWLFLENMY
jgi:hypothetical protein